MPDLATLQALRARVAEATGPDRDLDADVCVALQYVPGKTDAVNVCVTPNSSGRYLDHDTETVEFRVYGTRAYCTKTPKLTASVDVAHRLADRVLRKPFLIDLNWAHHLTEDPIRTTVDAVLTVDGAHVTEVRTEGFDGSSAVALAIIAATLDALIAQTEEAR